MPRLRLLLCLTLSCLLGLPAGRADSATPSDPPWWNTAWHQRYLVVFPPANPDSAAEAPIVEFKPDPPSPAGPYDVRAVDDLGTTLPLLVLYWSPGGKSSFLLDLDRRRTEGERRVWLYLGNPAAPAAYYATPWQNPALLVGDQLKRTDQRHGEWRWMPDPRFGAVHLGSAPDGTRATHAISSIGNVPLHPRRTRIVQRVWIDPSNPPEAISLEFFFREGIVSAYWTNAAQPPAERVATIRAVKIGPLPTPGEWALLQIRTQELELQGNALLDGIGFSNHGGAMKWGPTALGAMPVRGLLAARQVLQPDAAGTTVTVATPLREETRTYYSPGVLQLNIAAAPLFLEEKKPLSLTYALSPHYKYLGELPDCDVEILSLGANHAQRTIRVLQAAFIGGDNWQKTVEIAAADWAGAESILARVAGAGGETLTSCTLRLEKLAPVRNLRANGNLLQVGDDAVTFLPALGTARTTGPAPGAGALLLTASLNAPAAEGVLSVNSDTPRLGLPPRVSPFTRRSAAEWVVAAAHAAVGRQFRRVDLLIDRDLLDIGLPEKNVPLFLASLVRMLQNARGMEVHMDVSPLRAQLRTPRDQALLAACIEVEALIDR